MTSTVTSKGQVTIPKEIRSFLKIKPSDKIDFSIIDGQVVLKSIKTLKSFRGTVPKKRKKGLQLERQQAKAAISKKIIEEMK